MITDQNIDSDLCAQEPIHIVGAVQPHGALLVLHEPDLTILQASRSCRALLCWEPEQLRGRALHEVFGAAQVAPLRRDLNDANPLALELPGELGGAPRRFEGTAHHHDGLLILELEPERAPQLVLSVDQLMSRSIAQLQGTTTLAAAAAVAAEQVAQISGFERVMIYRFDESWNGEVIAERRHPDLEPYLGLRYPASDIPAQARRLFTSNRLRLIADVDYQPSPIVPQDNPRTGRPLDLSQAVLRSASPVHIEYLQNMGVKATLTLSLLVDDALWGLIACHHCAPRFLPYQVRAACAFLGQICSLHINTLLAREDQVQRASLRPVHARVTETLREGDLFAALARCQDSLLQLTGSGGAALWLHGRLALFGATPTEEQALALIGWLRGQAGGAPDLLHTRCLSDLHPEAASYAREAAGLLALPLLQDGAGWILWFRPEVIQTVDWAGDPRKTMRPGEGGRLHPRRSFALWQEILARHAAPFRSWDILAARIVRHDLVSTAAQDENRAAQAATRALKKAQQELLATARRAGMAEIANDVLHNVGNALNSVNVAAGSAVEQVRGSRLAALARGMALLGEHEHDLGRYLSEDPKGKKLAVYLMKLSEALQGEQRAMLQTLERVTEGVEHITSIVRTQQAHAGSCAIIEDTDLVTVVEDALRLSSATLLRHEVMVRREFAGRPVVPVDKHLMLQILINLISNAQQAMSAVAAERRVMTVSIERGAARVRVTVADQGVGIAPEHRHRLFTHGFTTRADGHGFGLHASALAAQQMNGTLTAHSEGVGQGAAFTLEFTASPAA